MNNESFTEPKNEEEEKDSSVKILQNETKFLISVSFGTFAFIPTVLLIDYCWTRYAQTLLKIPTLQFRLIHSKKKFD